LAGGEGQQVFFCLVEVRGGGARAPFNSVKEDRQRGQGNIYREEGGRGAVTKDLVLEIVKHFEETIQTERALKGYGKVESVYSKKRGLQ